MDPLFSAGRALGRAEFLRLEGKDGTAHLHAAGPELTRCGVPALAGPAQTLAAIAGSWQSRKGEIPIVIADIRDNHLARYFNKGYQAFCCGLLQGQAVEACLNADKDTEIERARTQVGQWLGAARDHAAALEQQCAVAGMAGFAGAFNARISAVTAARSGPQLRSEAQHVLNLSNQVGNRIR